MLGHHEAERGFALQRRLENRLAPEDPDKLAADVKGFTDQFGPSIARARIERKAREDERERLSAEHGAKLRAHGEELAAKLKAQEQKQRAGIPNRGN